jgi:hypothetical protein
MALLFILVANFGWGFVLDHYELVYSTLGVVHGAGYAAAHVTRVALWVMTGASGAGVCGPGHGVLPNYAPSTLSRGLWFTLALYVVGVMALPRPLSRPSW